MSKPFQAEESPPGGDQPTTTRALPSTITTLHQQPYCTGPSLRPVMKAVSQMPLPVAAGRKVGNAAALCHAAIASVPSVPVLEPVTAMPTVSRNWIVSEKLVN